MTKCTECKEGEMVVRKGKYGDFWACDNYPDCKHTEKLDPSVKAPVMPSKGEFHLTVEQSRIGAVTTAMNWIQFLDKKKPVDWTINDVLNASKLFEKYILTGA